MQRGASAHLPVTDFNSLALAVFAHQFENCPPYRRFCERHHLTPANVNVHTWQDIPAVPTAAFKEVAFAAGPVNSAQAVFRTSGTTRGQERRGEHHVLDLEMYYASLLPTFREFVIPDVTSIHMMSLIPHWRDAPDSSLSCMITQVVDAYGNERSACYVDPQTGIDYGRLNHDVDTATEPVCILGTSLAYRHWLEARTNNASLPPGSRIMDTGSFKGLERAITADELRAKYATQLGLPDEMCINEYGMTELCSQYYGREIKRGPSWLKHRILDPDTLAPVRA